MRGALLWGGGGEIVLARKEHYHNYLSLIYSPRLVGEYKDIVPFFFFRWVSAGVGTGVN